MTKKLLRKFAQISIILNIHDGRVLVSFIIGKFHLINNKKKTKLVLSFRIKQTCNKLRK